MSQIRRRRQRTCWTVAEDEAAVGGALLRLDSWLDRLLLRWLLGGDRWLPLPLSSLPGLLRFGTASLPLLLLLKCTRGSWWRGLWLR
jgi:hypothetical protein